MNRCAYLLRRAPVCLSLIVFSAVPALASKSDSVPDWVRTAATQKLPDYPPETDAVVLLDDMTYTVAPNGTATEHYRFALKILRPQGRKKAPVRVEFDKDSKLSLHVWSIGPDGHEYAVKDKDIIERAYGSEDGELYDDEKYKEANAPGADPGGVIAYEFERRQRPYLAEQTWWVQGDLPEVNQSFTLELPPGYTYSTVWAHHDPVKGADLEHQRWRWEMNNMPAIDLRHVLYRPSELSLAPHMTVHYGPEGSLSVKGDWSSIGEWYIGLSHDRLAATPEIAAKTKEIVGDKTDFYDKTQAVADFMQTQIRYFAIEVGIGGYQPHFAGDIFHNRYGDCKDKATLLSSMLSTIGIHSALMMVDHRHGVVDPDAPSIVGDHMIAAIEIPAGYSSPKLHSVVTAKTGKRYLIYDPTSEKTPFGEIEHELQGSYGLLIEGGNSEIIRIPLLDPALNTIHRTGKFQVQPDGSIKGTVTERRIGDGSRELRYLYTHGDEKEQKEYLDHLLAEDFATFKVSNFKAENADTLNKELTTSFTVTADSFAKVMGPLLMVRPRVFGTDSLEIDHKKRSVPIDLEETVQAVDDYTIELPAGYTVDDLPEPVKLDLQFASYRSESHTKGNVVEYTRTYTVRQPIVGPERYADLQKLAMTIGADEESRAVLKKQ
jgi:hypothetical protein